MVWIAQRPAKATERQEGGKDEREGERERPSLASAWSQEGRPEAGRGQAWPAGDLVAGWQRDGSRGETRKATIRMVACWQVEMTVVSLVLLREDALGTQGDHFASAPDFCWSILACTVRPGRSLMVVLDATRERMARRNDQRTGQVVLVPPSDLSPCFIKRQGLPPNVVSIHQIGFPLAIVSEIQTHKGTTTHKMQETIDDGLRLFGRHRQRIRGHAGA